MLSTKLISNPKLQFIGIGLFIVFIVSFNFYLLYSVVQGLNHNQSFESEIVLK